MNQRPRTPLKGQGPSGSYWRHHYHHPYWRYYYYDYYWPDYYYYDTYDYGDYSDYYDYYDNYLFAKPSKQSRAPSKRDVKAGRPVREPMGLKVDPNLIADLFKHVRDVRPADSHIHDMVNRMVELSQAGEYLDSSDYDYIVGEMMMEKPEPSPMPQPTGPYPGNQ